MANEIERKAVNGIPALLVFLLAGAGAVVLFAKGAATDSTVLLVGALVLAFILLLCMIGLFSVQPNQAKVLTLFGEYVGTVKTPGLWWANPFFIKRSISLRVRNFETAEAQGE